jgi:DNA-directed RNA polymerase specialized sigma24 family protein
MDAPLRRRLSQREVGRFLGIPHANVHWHEQKALAKLRKALEPMLTKEELERIRRMNA